MLGTLWKVGGIQMRGYIGVDVGSVSTNLVLAGENDSFIDSVYLRTRGNPI